MKPRLLAKLILVFTLALTAGCRPKKGRSGGVDGGGGEVAKSTHEQVRAAVDEGIGHFSQTDPRLNLVHLFSQTLWEESDLAKLNGHQIDASSPVLRLRTNRITYKDKGDCPSPDGKHADASVSSLKPSADICISVGNLTRLPPQSLRYEIWSLLLHEVAHLAGSNEEQAQFYQTQFRKFLTEKFPDLETKQVREMLTDAFKTALGQSVIHLQNIPGYSPDYQITGQYSQELQRSAFLVRKAIDKIPLLFEPLRLKLYTEPKRPELFDNYMNSLLASRARIEAVYLKFRDGGPEEKTAGDIRALSEQSLVSLTRAAHILQVYLFGEGESDCELAAPYAIRMARPWANGTTHKKVESHPFAKVEYVDEMPPGHSFEQRLYPVMPPNSCGATQKVLNFDVALDEVEPYPAMEIEEMVAKVTWLGEAQLAELKTCIEKRSNIFGVEDEVHNCIVKSDNGEWPTERIDYLYKNFQIREFQRVLRYYSRSWETGSYRIYIGATASAYVKASRQTMITAIKARDAGDKLLWMHESNWQMKYERERFAESMRAVRAAAASDDLQLREDAVKALEYLERKYQRLIRNCPAPQRGTSC